MLVRRSAFPANASFSSEVLAPGRALRVQVIANGYEWDVANLHNESLSALELAHVCGKLLALVDHALERPTTRLGLIGGDLNLLSPDEEALHEDGRSAELAPEVGLVLFRGECSFVAKVGVHPVVLP